MEVYPRHDQLRLEARADTGYQSRHPAHCSKGADDAGAPEVDIVFVHGIRGGPFASWVHLEMPAARRRRLNHDNCWPSAWLAADVPSARLLSLQYAGEAFTSSKL